MEMLEITYFGHEDLPPNFPATLLQTSPTGTSTLKKYLSKANNIPYPVPTPTGIPRTPTNLTNPVTPQTPGQNNDSFELAERKNGDLCWTEDRNYKRQRHTLNVLWNTTLVRATHKNKRDDKISNNNSSNYIPSCTSKLHVYPTQNLRKNPQCKKTVTVHLSRYFSRIFQL